jgi:glycosyltransferase involved in cell wall biosynthesis
MNHYPDSRNGGIENVTRMLSEKFLQMGHVVDVAYISSSMYDNNDNTIFRRVVHIDSKNIEPIIRNFIKGAKTDVIINRCVTYASPLLREAIKDSDCILVTTYNNKPTITPPTLNELWRNKKVRLGIKLLCSVIYPIFCLRSKKRIREKHQISYAVSDLTVLLSQKYVSEYCDMMKIGSEKIDVKNNPIRDSLHISKDEFNHKGKTILMVTRLDETQKCVIKALKIWSHIVPYFADWNLKIIGSGPDEDKIKEFAIKNDINNVEFIPACKPDEYYKEASIFLMTSRNEGWPNTINEAMRMGCLPVVIATFSAIYDMIDHKENGIIIPDGENEINQCADVLTELIKDERMRKSLSFGAIAKTKRLSIEVISQEWSETLQNLIVH